MMLLNPGPVNVSERVRQALNRPDICHRESDFAELQDGIQNKLLKAFVPGAEADYTAVLISGSGTAAVESALMSSIPHGKRALIINNGVYGERMAQMVGLHICGVDMVCENDHGCAGIERVSDSRQRSLDAGVIRDRAVLERYVEIDPDQDLLPLQVSQVGDGLLRHW